tara:strand:- start:1405 stop:1611 length:207 start_codon:yes stop_codon:yes gene_type:complete
MTHPMNMPYISLQTAFQIIDEIANEYDILAREGKNSDEKRVGRVGLTSALKIKKGLIAEVKKRERSFD